MFQLSSSSIHFYVLVFYAVRLGLVQYVMAYVIYVDCLLSDSGIFFYVLYKLKQIASTQIRL